MKSRGRELAICCCLLLWFAVTSWAEMAVQTCFSPQGRCSAHIIREIEKAQKELLIAVYAFTNDEARTRGGASEKTRRFGPDRVRPRIRCGERKIPGKIFGRSKKFL